MPDHARALVFSPPPPPPGGLPGGIAAITAVLMREIGDLPGVIFAAPVRKEDGGRLGLRRGAANLLRLVRATARLHRDGTVLFFSSAGFSFWEKCAWSLLVRSMGRDVAIVMVDGNFPTYFARLPIAAKWLARAIMRGSHLRIGAQSPAWKEFYRSIMPDARIECVTASVDREFFAAHQTHAEADGTLRVLYVGWIIEAKGVLDLLDAVALVRADLARRFVVRLVGPLLDGPERWRREVKTRQLGDVVTFVGSITQRSALLEEYRSADLFVFPSHFEGFPVALVEAAAVGLPAIGTAVGGVPDILDRGRAGVVVQPRAPEQLAAAIRMLLSDDARRTTLGVALADHARREYTHDACGRSYLRLLGLVADAGSTALTLEAHPGILSPSGKTEASLDS